VLAPAICDITTNGRRRLRVRAAELSISRDLHASTPSLHHHRLVTLPMCGIFCSLSRHGFVAPDNNTKRLLQNRGPDSTGQHETLIQADFAPIHATFLSTVLALRGSSVVEQPLIDDATGSVLCWNGEAWSIGPILVEGNDSTLVFEQLLKACNNSSDESKSAVIRLLSSIRGPYALVFYDASNERIYYGRDCLGRRSLLSKSMPNGTLLLSSVCDIASGEGWQEVEADGMYIVDLQVEDATQPSITASCIPHRRSDEEDKSRLEFVGKSCRPRFLLTTVDIAISRHESLSAYPRIAPRHGYHH